MNNTKPLEDNTPGKPINIGEIPPGWSLGDTLMIARPDNPPHAEQYPFLLINPTFDPEAEGAVGAIWFKGRSMLLLWVDAWLAMGDEADGCGEFKVCDSYKRRE